MAATAKQAKQTPLMGVELQDELDRIGKALSAAFNLTDNLMLRMQGVTQLDLSEVDTWVIAGFTDDALLDLKVLIQDVLKLRGMASGCISPDEEELRAAVGVRDV